MSDIVPFGTPLYAEPPDWFAGEQHVLTFSHRNPHATAHRKSRICREGYPHHVTECGYFKTAGTDGTKRRGVRS
jgi:hypothetical protein